MTTDTAGLRVVAWLTQTGIDCLTEGSGLVRVMPAQSAMFNVPLVTLAEATERIRALEAQIKDAFYSGYTSVSTYNDKELTDVDDEWAKYKAARAKATGEQA